MVVERLRAVTEVAVPGGAFYAFVKVPERLGMTASAFVEKCIEKSVLVIPGSVFSSRDTHFRLSYATEERVLERGLGVLVGLMGGS
jgi:aspartate/methionine/tyrosine aminotransferase